MAWTGIRRQKITNPKTTSLPQKFSFAKEYAQGRAIAYFNSSDPEGYVANKPNVWGTMPYKGLIYFSDMNNGLWAIRLEEENMGTN